MKPNHYLNQKVPSQDMFFRAWVEFLTPFHHLTAREKEVMARIIAQYFKLKESIQDKELLRDVLWSQSSCKDMRESLNMSPAFFRMTLAKLRSAGVIRDGDLYYKYLPNLGEDPRFCLQIVFDWSTPENRIHADKQNGQG